MQFRRRIIKIIIIKQYASINYINYNSIAIYTQSYNRYDSGVDTVTINYKLLT